MNESGTNATILYRINNKATSDAARPDRTSALRPQMATSIMPHLVSIYDLFDKTSFRYWEREIAQGRLPTSTELTDLLNANRDVQLPL
jgi:hypothetical protein